MQTKTILVALVSTIPFVCALQPTPVSTFSQEQVRPICVLYFTQPSAPSAPSASNEVPTDTTNHPSPRKSPET